MRPAGMAEWGMKITVFFTCRYSSADTLGEPDKVVHQACLPDDLVGAMRQVGIF